MKQPLLGLTLTELQTVVKNLGLPGFAAKQIAAWLYDKKVASIDLGKPFDKCRTAFSFVQLYSYLCKG